MSAKSGAPQEHERDVMCKYRRLSTYALQPSPKWAKPNWINLVLLSAYVFLATICFAVDPGTLVVRAVYTTMAMAGLLYRVKYFTKREWLLFFIDLCFVTSIVLVASLWLCLYVGCSQDWLIAIYGACTGPVPGAVFMLQTPFTLHHPEAFESFFLHATPMWIGYYERWVWGENVFSANVPSVQHLVWCGFSRFYLTWAIPYLIFLLLQPLMCEKIASYETLMDGFIFGGGSTREQRLEEKRQHYWRFQAKIVTFVVGHAVMSLSGFLAAALAFRSWHTQVLWILCIQASGFVSGYHFYSRSLDPDYTMPSFLAGFIRMGMAWCLVLPTYFFAPGTKAAWAP